MKHDSTPSGELLLLQKLEEVGSSVKVETEQDIQYCYLPIISGIIKDQEKQKV